MIPLSLVLPIIVRSTTLVLSHTFFQPDEFYQAYEVAHHKVFGYGYLTWEWNDLPPVPSALNVSGIGLGQGQDGWWDKIVVGGRMRGWLWPSLFVGVYKLLQATKLDQTELIVIAPRMVGVLVASLTDWYTYHLSGKLLGPGSTASALFLSLTSLFHAHLLPRALSTSPETLLTTMALYYFPFPKPSPPSRDPLRTITNGDDDVKTPVHEQIPEVKVQDRPRSGYLNYVAMDRSVPFLNEKLVKDNLALSIFLATIALCIRPTTLPLWAFLGLDLLRRRYIEAGIGSAFRVFVVSALVGLATLATSTYIDYSFTGRLYFPILTFINQNVVQNISSFYGSTNHLYHLSQSLPIMLFPIWYWWAKGFTANLLPDKVLPGSLRDIDKPDGLHLLSRAIAFSIGLLSLSPHSEWRFLHPFLPPLLLFAIPGFAPSYKPRLIVALSRWKMIGAMRQYTRIPKRTFYFILFAPILPWIYLNAYHGRAQVEVMNVLRRRELGNVSGLVELMPCHSTPWMSGLHKNVDGWFVTCEPPLGLDPKVHRTQQELFYQSPVSYLQHVFPYPPVQLHDIPKSTVGPTKPSHILLFGELLDMTEYTNGSSVSVSVEDALGQLGYSAVWSGWNGFDILQDEEKRRGGVQVWRLKQDAT
ncbi:hypothetical protein I317_02367 [Kwoniella heveanensis CBS 569]|nr:hypothetical protein I317_02367 [Kwoniella heveanensis CBS 569]